jgi:hypothetical protein
MSTETHIEELLKVLSTRQGQILHRLEDIDELLHDAVIELGGIPGSMGRDPNRATIRSRLHKLETDSTAARTAEAAILAAKEIRAAAYEKRFTHRERFAVLVLTVLLLICPFIAQVIAK